jgi:hypothetical protein
MLSAVAEWKKLEIPARWVRLAVGSDPNRERCRFKLRFFIRGHGGAFGRNSAVTAVMLRLSER